MPIEIIVEDGSNVENANSYISVANAIIYAGNRGLTLPSVEDSEDTVGSLLIRAVDYLETFGNKFLGSVVSSSQSLQWPRADVILNGFSFASDSIPNQLIAAQVEIAVAINEGFNPLQNYSNQDFIIKEQVGPIAATYADPIKAGYGPRTPYIDKLIGLLCGNSNSNLQTIRA